ncbi:hypothetical protein GH714_038542 [Hevea brasiliensis]|uniref:PGG domain-containing protein n=1 Tax=Hevea brasiliensis TaxID=3981 RepID=A0A6A6N6N9_HEVBR|nr:hypothetical protein GH714_038542 [Hevea brasiliensis]
MDQRLTEAAPIRDIGERLRQAARAGDIDALYALIREDARVLERVDEVPFVDTPLHIAASAGHIQFAMEIVNLKASFTRKLNPDGHSVHQEARTSRLKSRSWVWKLCRHTKWKSSERRNTELLVETLILTAMYQASLSPPGGLWQGTADINLPIRVSNSSTSVATSLHFTVLLGILIRFALYYLTLPSEPRVKPRRPRQTILGRKEWW